MNIFHNRFTTSEVIEATGVKNDNLQNWLRRPLIVGHKDIEGGGSQGRPRLFSFHNLMEIAAAKALLDAGMADLKAVFAAAASFAHSAPGAVGSDSQRVPGCPFPPGGITLLAAGPDWHEVVHVSTSDSALGLYTKLLFNFGTIREGCVIVDVGKVFDRVVRRIGDSPEAVLRIAYPR